MTVSQRATATRLITSKGQAVSLSWASGTTYDPATGGVSGSTTTVTTTGTLLPLDKTRKIDGTNIMAGDETLLLSALDATGATYAEPPVNTVVTLADGSKRVIVAIDQLAPAGLVIMFDAVVRRAV